MATTKRAATPWLKPVQAADVMAAVADLLVDVAVVGVDADGRVTLWNDAASRWYGRTAKAAIGKPCPDLPGAHRHLFVGPHGHALGAVAIGPTGEAPHALLPPPRDVQTFHGLITRAPAMLRVLDIVRNVARSDVTVLVRGESGSGKELIAGAIHAESLRSSRPFVAVNCAAFSPMLLESELFGHKKGAFTGAVADRQGIFEQAHGGTLFLDEVGDLPLELQGKLLRVLEEHVFVPVGGTRPIKVDVRVIAATHRALREEVKAGRFREDLMYRLRVVPIFLPALRERPADVPILLDHLIRRANERGARTVEHIAPDAMRLLLAHSWPGNVRELQNVVEYAFAVGHGPSLGLQDLPPEFHEARAREHASANDEASAIREALATHGDVGHAAEALGLSRTTFWRRRKSLGV